jgi:hypothetical protein
MSSGAKGRGGGWMRRRFGAGSQLVAGRGKAAEEESMSLFPLWEKSTFKGNVRASVEAVRLERHFQV